MIRERSEMEDDPLMFALKLTENRNPKMKKYIDLITNRNRSDDLNIVKQSISNGTITRFVTYANKNGDLSMHNVYASSLGDMIDTS